MILVLYTNDVKLRTLFSNALFSPSEQYYSTAGHILTWVHPSSKLCDVSLHGSVIIYFSNVLLMDTWISSILL